MFAFSRSFLSFLPLTLLLGMVLAGSEARAQEDAAGDPVTSQVEDSVGILNRLPSFSLTDQDGEEVASHDLYGHVWVASFISTRCGDECDRQVEAMSELEDDLEEMQVWEDTRLVSISLDPEHDTPAVLSTYIEDRNLDASQWHFLTGDREAIRDLGMNGFRLPAADDARETEIPVSPGSRFALVDWEGRVRGYYDSSEEEDLRILRRDLARVTFERVVFPPEAESPDWIEGRMQAQLEAAEDFNVFHDFRFSNEVENTNITFHHKVVDDAASEYKAVHYDHGNAIAVADVDGDGLHDIYFTTQAGRNELWRNLGDGTFENITDSAGVEVEDRISVGASFADIDNDGDPDLYVTTVREGNVLFENDGEGNFTDISEQSGTDIRAHSSGAVFFDYDRDGLLDLFVTNVGVYTTDTVSNVSLYTEQGQVISDYEYHVGFTDAFLGHMHPERTETSVLFRNLGDNRFEDVSEEVNLVDSGWSGDATVIDGNNDGWPDLYVLNMQGDDAYYENVEGETFVEKSGEFFPRTPWGAMGVKSFDFDNDGNMDLYITDMHSDMADLLDVSEEKMKMTTRYRDAVLQGGENNIYGNAFYLNEGGGRFSEISDQIGAENYWPWGLSSGDLNADGFEDVFIASSMNFPLRYGINSLLLNDEGRGFLDSEYVLGVEPRKHGITVAPWFELHCSGRDSSHDLCGNARGRRVIWGALGSRSSAVFDLDQDGDLDIVTLEFNQPPMVLVSNLSEEKELRFLKVKLVGTESNRGGIGARVAVFAGGDVYTKRQDGKSGYLSQSLYPLYFGLGNHTEIDRIEVSWPSGKTQVVDGDIAMNGVLEIEEPE